MSCQFGNVVDRYLQVWNETHATARASSAPAAGFDVAVLDPSGRISAVHGFLDRVPA